MTRRLIARRVAMAAAAWCKAPAGVEAYRRLAAAVGGWNAFCVPAFEHQRRRATSASTTSPPLPLGDGIVDPEPRPAGRPAAPADPPAACARPLLCVGGDGHRQPQPGGGNGRRS
jgi:hypothetical protein